MKLVAVDRSMAKPVEAGGHFDGKVAMQDLNLEAPPDGVELVAVFFDAGARTLPHTHPVEQTLIVLEGEGVYADEGGRRRFRAGEIVVVPAGIWHWHGATPDSAMCHISAKHPGDTTWEGVELRDWDAYMGAASTA